MNNSAKFDELEFLDEDNDDGCGRGDHMLPFHWPKGCMQPFRKMGVRREVKHADINETISNLIALIFHPKHW